MDAWIQAIYDATGIPLDDGDLQLAVHGDQGWLVLHGVEVVPVPADPDPREVVTPAIRGALARAMGQRLGRVVPEVRRLLDVLDAARAGEVGVQVVDAEGSADSPLAHEGPERGWPHFVLRLSAGGFDVEVDLNPYVLDDPLDLDEVGRQAEVILQVARMA